MTTKILVGCVRDRLRDLADGSVHCIITSPPYFGLRDYGTAQWEGGDRDCSHRVGNQVQDGKAKGAVTSGVRPGADTSRCLDCGADRVDSQIGLEATPDAYVATLVEVFREARRVLRDDGTLWLNLGDSYNAYNGGAGPTSSLSRGAQTEQRPQLASGYGLKFKGLKPKDLIGIPWRVAFALQADGWYLRSDIIWAKKNCMPESVTDRPTSAHEHIFLLSKRERYWYDADAVRVPYNEASIGRYATSKQSTAPMGRQPGGDITRKVREEAIRDPNPAGRNLRNVWTIATQPYSEAHFATFPPALIEPCIKAGCPTGGTVLDPFGGAGTTGLVADRLGRDAILIELNAAYAEMARRRIEGDAGLFAGVSFLAAE